MTTLTEKIWQEFFIEEIFNILPGKRLTKADMIAGDTPFIGASDSNNGVTCFVGNDNDSADENFLSVSYNGSVCQCFYHPYRCLCSDDVKRFHLKNRAGNKYIYLFMKSIIEKQRGKYNYGYKFNETRMRRQKIMLPVNDKGEPDYNFMENYVRAVEEKQLQRYRDYVQALDAAKIPPLNEKIWRPFFIKDLFVTIRNGLQVPTGAYVSKEHLIEGDTPRITVTGNNNGVYGFYHSTDKNYKVHENFISVSFLGDCFYHPYKASLDMKVHCLKLADRELNRFVALFLIRMFKQMTAVFNYGDQLSSKDIVNKKIQLPINDSGAPDFEYMEAYVKNSMAAQYRKYLEYLGDD